MSVAPDMRAGDGDRDQTISRLREAFAEGRLSTEEFEQRMSAANVAKTYGELSVLVEDLPAVAPTPAVAATPVPAVPTTAAAAEVQSDEDHSVRNGWASWLGVSVLVNVIYFATWLTQGGSAPYYWPIWVMGPWGAAILIHTLSKRD
ncbi:MAG: DUF1707 domain-containing protein [Actinomycetes bacterium]